MDEDTRKFIDEHFKIVIEHPDKYTYNPDSYELRVTHNGNQWSVIGFMSTDEIKQLIKALQIAIDEK